jgi:uncharacterized protein (DUF2267 family)
MSQQGLEVLDATVQKTHEWINAVAETAHLEKSDAYKALRAVLHTLRDRLRVEHTAHLSAQLPMLIRGLLYEGWEPTKVPKKMHLPEFLESVQEKIITNRFIDPERVTRDVFEVMNRFIAPGELRKIKACLPAEFQELCEPMAHA